MEKTTTKKIIGGLIIATLIATIGAVMVNAEIENEDETDGMQMHFRNRELMRERQPFISELAEEQQAEIDALIESLNEQGASQEEIREAINTKLDEMGILDERLDSEIEQTEQRLTMLSRQKELREQGYCWEEINEIIQEEFDIEIPNKMNDNIGFGRGPHDRSSGCHFDNPPSDQTSEETDDADL